MEREEIQKGPDEVGGDGGENPGREGPSAKVIHHAMHPEHMGEMEKPDGYAAITGTCNDRDEFFLKIFSSRIQEARFCTNGCFYTIACCEVVATLAEGRTVREAMRIGQDAVIEYLDGLPEDHKHCALLAAGTLYQALRNYIVRGQGL